MVNKSGLIAGVFGFLVVFISEIPFYPPQNLNLRFNLFSFDDIDFYIWGYVVSPSESYSFLSFDGYDILIPFSLWLILIYISISSIMISGKNSIKLYNINIILTSLLLLIYGSQIFFAYISNLVLFFFNIGLGYYFIGIILILNLTAKNSIKKKIN